MEEVDVVSSDHHGPEMLSMAHIFRVPVPLRSVNPMAFTPQMVTIGPYHKNLTEPQFEEMENYKLLAARMVAQDMKDGEFNRLVEYIVRNETMIRSHYYRELESEDLSAEKLAKMIALDATFVVAVLHSFYDEHAGREKSVGKHLWDSQGLPSRFSSVYTDKFSPPVRKAIMLDLLLLENQVPLFVVKKIIRMDERCKSDEEAEKRLEAFVATMAQRVLPFTKSKENVESGVHGLGEGRKHLLDCLYHIVTYDMKTRDPELDLYPVEVPGATKLSKAGVEISGHSRSLRKISFDKPTLFGKAKLSVPKIHVGDDTETIFRNLVAYESHMVDRVDVLSYLHFMNYLIDSPQDVDMLVERKIMTETMGSNNHVAKMWNELCINTDFVFSKQYSDVAKAAKKHYESKLQGLWAEFHRRYLSKPWLVVSLLAAVVELVLTLVIMWYSILLYRKEG